MTTSTTTTTTMKKKFEKVYLATLVFFLSLFRFLPLDAQFSSILKTLKSRVVFINIQAQFLVIETVQLSGKVKVKQHHPWSFVRWLQVGIIFHLPRDFCCAVFFHFLNFLNICLHLKY